MIPLRSRDTAMPHRSRRIFVTGANDKRSFSGCSFYFAADLRDRVQGDPVVPVPLLHYRAMRPALIAWAARMRADPRPYYYMTRQYHDRNLRSIGEELRDDDVYLSFAPVLPSRDRLKGARSVLIVDMTLQQYLGYEHFGRFPDRIRQDIIAQERESYGRCERIFAITPSVRDQLVTLYAVPDDKIEVIGRGINFPGIESLDLGAGPHGEAREPGRLRIGFVGHDFKRKGLPMLIEAIDRNGWGGVVTVEAVGPGPGDLPARPYLNLHGYIDKDTDMHRYSRLLASCDVGYLVSQSEGVPGSILEFLSLGVPCLISDIPEMETLQALPGVSCLPLSEGASAVGGALRNLLSSPDRLRAMRARAATNAFDGWARQAEAVARWCA